MPENNLILLFPSSFSYLSLKMFSVSTSLQENRLSQTELELSFSPSVLFFCGVSGVRNGVKSLTKLLKPKANDDIETWFWRKFPTIRSRDQALPSPPLPTFVKKSENFFSIFCSVVLFVVVVVVIVVVVVVVGVAV